MNEVLERRFASVGARLSPVEQPWRGAPRIDVLSDRDGEFFAIRCDRNGTETDVEALGAVGAPTFRDRPTEGRRALNAETEVRILVPDSPSRWRRTLAGV